MMASKKLMLLACVLAMTLVSARHDHHGKHHGRHHGGRHSKHGHHEHHHHDSHDSYSNDDREEPTGFMKFIRGYSRLPKGVKITIFVFLAVVACCFGGAYAQAKIDNNGLQKFGY